MMNRNVRTFVFLLSCSFPSVFGFKCYVCNSKNDMDCASPPNERHLKNCEDILYENNKGESFKVCRLQVIQNESKKAVYDRRCGWKKHNEDRESCLLTPDAVLKAINCECHTESCNPAMWNRASFELLSLLIAIVVFIIHRVN